MSTPAPNAVDLSGRRDLGVAWMNRGHALQQDGQVTAAIAAYAEAITLLRTLPPAQNPSWANSLGAAWMNHGQLLHRAYGTRCADEALASFDAATAVLRPIAGGGELARDSSLFAWLRRNLAGVLLNRANLLIDLARHAEAAAAAREALALCRPHERTDPVDAELALKTRRAACDAIGSLLMVTGADQDGLAAEASDLVDDALALTRHWSAAGVTAFLSLTERFFRYGTQLYRFHQPHFLAEFIRENLTPANRSLHDIALEAIDAALAGQSRPGIFLTLNDPASERRVQTWRELEALRTRIAA